MKTPLKTIVAQYLDSGDQSSHDFRRIYNFGVRGCQEFNLDIYGALKTVVLDVSANKTVEIPKDYITFSKIGVLNSSGEIMSLGQNRSLTTLSADLQRDLIQVTDPYIYSPTRTPLIWFNYGIDGVGYNVFGLAYGGGTIGQYKINESGGVINLSSDWVYPQVVLEYLSDGLDCDVDDYMIDVRAAECFICYLRWRDSQDSRKKFGRNEVNFLKREYYRERRLAKMRINPTIIAEMQNVFRSSIRLTARA